MLCPDVPLMICLILKCFAWRARTLCPIRNFAENLLNLCLFRNIQCSVWLTEKCELNQPILKRPKYCIKLFNSIILINTSSLS